MDQLNPQPTSPDAQVTVDATGAGGTEAGQGSEAAKSAIELERLSEALGRKFSTVDEALKTVTNLNGLVGDRSIQDLRKKAEAHDTFEALVEGYAKEEGLSQNEARKFLSDLAKGSAPQKDERVDSIAREVSDLKMTIQESAFLKDNPEASRVIKELKTLASATGQTLAEAYASSSLRDLAVKAAASEERAQMGTGLRPSSRTGVPNDKVRAAVERLKSDSSGDAQDNYVKEVLGL